MRFPWTKGSELREDTRTGFSEQSIDAAVEAATGASPELAAARTAAAEFGVGLFARAFASATVEPPVAALTPVVLASLIRRLLLTGNAVYRVRVSPRTGIELDAASSFDITGRSNPETWFYRMDIPAPSVGERAHARYASVVHVRLNAAILSLDGMGFRQREIAEVVDISRRRVGQILQELARNGESEFWEPYT